jgi:immunity protein 5 of polymorphic toxin system
MEDSIYRSASFAIDRVHELASSHPELVARVVERLGNSPTAHYDHRAITAADLHASGSNLSELTLILSTLALTDTEIKRRLRLWSADCVSPALHHFEAVQPSDKRVRQAIVIARRFARGEIRHMDGARQDVLSALEFVSNPNARAVARAASYITREHDSWADNVAAKMVRRLCQKPASQIGGDWQLNRLLERFASEPPDVPVCQPSTGPVRIPHEQLAACVLPPRNVQFTGRGVELQTLDRLICDSPIVAIENAANTRRRVGKTALALEFAHRHRQHFGQVFWIWAPTQRHLVSGLSSIALRLDPNLALITNVDDRIRCGLVRLAKANPPHLIVCDNVGYATASVFPFPATSVRVLVTTRKATFPCSSFALADLSQEDAIELLQRISGHHAPEAAAKIVLKCGRSPYLIEKIGHNCLGEEGFVHRL